MSDGDSSGLYRCLVRQVPNALFQWFPACDPQDLNICITVYGGGGGVYITLLGPTVHTAEKEPLPYSGLNTNSCNRFDTFPSVSCL